MQTFLSASGEFGNVVFSASDTAKSSGIFCNCGARCDLFDTPFALSKDSPSSSITNLLDVVEVESIVVADLFSASCAGSLLNCKLFVCVCSLVSLANGVRVLGTKSAQR